MDDFTYATRWKDAAQRPQGLVGTSRALIRNAILSAASMVPGARPGTFLRGLYCHYVFEDQREAFEGILRELKNLGTFVDTAACLSMLQGERPIDQAYFHLSIDDGFRNHFTHALPVLQKLDVPAIFFVPTSLVHADIQSAADYCLHTARYPGVVEMLRWDDLREMISRGYEIGSHTRSHARFTEISADRELLASEIIGSKNDLEEGLGVACRYISWPFGMRVDADDASISMVRQAGYSACFGGYRGTISPGVTDPFRIPRHHFEAQWPLSHVKYFASGHMER